MLKDDFYIIKAIDVNVSPVTFTLQLNKEHRIFNGHFPGQPVVPGACLMQIIKEIAEVTVEKKLDIARADELKFLVPVNPAEDDILEGNMQYATDENNIVNVIGSFSQNSTVCFKCKITFTTK